MQRKIKRTNVHAVVNKGGGHVTRSEAPVISTVTGQPELIGDIRNPSMVVSSERQLWNGKIVRVGKYLVTFLSNH